MNKSIFDAKNLTWAALHNESQVLLVTQPIPSWSGYPDSAVQELIEAIYETYPDQARSWVRHRILTSLPCNERDWGTARVSAKAIRFSVTPEEAMAEWGPRTVQLLKRRDPKARSTNETSKTLRFESTHEALQHTLTLVPPRPADVPKYSTHRPIAALLADSNGNVLGHATNTNANNKVLHAELNLIRDFCRSSQRKIPRGAQLFATLKPCKMCAGTLWEAAEDPWSLKVYYAEHDPGRNAYRTVLDPGTFERERVLSAVQAPSEEKSRLLQLKLEELLLLPD